jgi:hypothetical protein
MQCSTEYWLNEAMTSAHGVWNIGQIDKATARALDKLVKAGKLVKSTGLFQGLMSPPQGDLAQAGRDIPVDRGCNTESLTPRRGASAPDLVASRGLRR